MSALELPLPFIGWLFTLVSAAALAFGLLLMVMLARAGNLERRYLSYSLWNDLLLAAIWGLGFAGGIGVIRLQPWGRYILELFCWALIVLVPLSAASRLYALKHQPDPDAPPVNWLGAAAGVMVVLIPVLAICGATIVTLRSAETQKVFSEN